MQNRLPGFLRSLVNIHNLNHYEQFSSRYLSWKLIQAIDVKSTRNWDFVPACKPLDMVKLQPILFRAFGNNFPVSCIVLPLNCVWIFGSTKSILLASCVGSHGYQRIPFGYGLYMRALAFSSCVVCDMGGTPRSKPDIRDNLQ